MKVKVMYCKYVRKNGTCNMVWFDTEKREFTSADTLYRRCDVFIEAQQSKDVNSLREHLRKEGWQEFID